MCKLCIYFIMVHRVHHSCEESLFWMNLPYFLKGLKPNAKL
jgi:hypothetical protein